MSWHTSHDPDRAGLPLQHWPLECLAAWEAAKQQRPGPFRKNGGGTRRSIAMVLKSENGLRRLFGFALRSGMLHAASTPPDLLMPELLDTYFAHLLACGNADRSIVGRFEELGFAFRLMYPEQDFRWLTKPDGIALSTLLPMRTKPRFVPSSAVLLEWAEELYQNSLKITDPQVRWAGIRDALMIAILATRAPRLRALASLQLGTHMIREPAGWLLDQHASITKTSIDLLLPLSAEIGAMADRYVSVERPQMLRGHSSDAFWIGWQSGRPLQATSISGLIWRRTLRRFGVGFCPHRFRTSLTTTLAMENPSAPFDAAYLCGHSHRTSLTHYNEAKATRATHRQADRLRALRDETEELANLAYAGKL